MQPKQPIPFYPKAPIALLAFALFILLGTLLTSFLIKQNTRKIAIEKRNAFVNQMWVPHVFQSDKGKADELLVIIISNSQGFDKQLQDQQLYPNKLEEHLAKLVNKPVRVLNWSIFGGNAPEFVLLGAATNRLNPDILLLIATQRNFNERYLLLNPKTESHYPWGSDTQLLLGYWDVTRHVPIEFVSHFFNFRDLIEIGLARIWPSWHYRQMPLMHLRENQPFKHAEPHLRKELYPYGGTDEARVLERLEAYRKHKLTGWNLVEYFLSSTASLKTRKIYVEMPRRPRREFSLKEEQEQFYRTLNSGGFEIRDLSSSIPETLFLGDLYLKPEGHELFAQNLAELIIQ